MYDMMMEFFFILCLLLPAEPGQYAGSAGPDHPGSLDVQSPKMENDDIRQYCYASRTKAATGVPGDHYNYIFLRFLIDGDKVRGTWCTYPYGTDRMEASLAGVYHASTGEIHLQADMLAEGEFYQQSRSLKLLENAVQLDFKNAQQNPATVPQVSCMEFDAMLKEFHGGILQNAVNTTDRSRLLKVGALSAMGLPGGALQNVKFMEREVNLDRDYETREFLLYIMDPMICGTGGCNLFVINEDGELLSETSVVKLPVYTTSLTIEDEQQHKGHWKDLYAWSQGLRRLTPDSKGKYPENASVQFPVVEEQIALHPERFTLLLDYFE